MAGTCSDDALGRAEEDHGHGETVESFRRRSGQGWEVWSHWRRGGSARVRSTMMKQVACKLVRTPVGSFSSAWASQATVLQRVRESGFMRERQSIAWREREEKERKFPQRGGNCASGRRERHGNLADVWREKRGEERESENSCARGTYAKREKGSEHRERLT